MCVCVRVCVGVGVCGCTCLGSGVCQTEAGEISSGSSWLQKETCSVCSCDLTGQVTCSPLQCARLNCSDTVQMAGTCCPVCRGKSIIVAKGRFRLPIRSGGMEKSPW